MSFWYLQFSQKPNKKIRLYYYGTSIRIVFVRLLGELKTPKRHFEINWPLAGNPSKAETFFFQLSGDGDFVVMLAFWPITIQRSSQHCQTMLEIFAEHQKFLVLRWSQFEYMHLINCLLLRKTYSWNKKYKHWYCVLTSVFKPVVYE